VIRHFHHRNHYEEEIIVLSFVFLSFFLSFFLTDHHRTSRISERIFGHDQDWNNGFHLVDSCQLNSIENIQNYDFTIRFVLPPAPSVIRKRRRRSSND